MPYFVDTRKIIVIPRWVVKNFAALYFFCLLTTGLFAQAPSITSFSPVSGAVGAPVTITGAGFSTTPSNNIVFFGPVKAAVSAASASSLTVTVPAGANYQPITVTVNGLTAYSTKPFLVTYSDGGNWVPSSYDQKVDFSTNLHPNAIVLVDLDGDGKPDMATADNFSTTGVPGAVSILRNIGTVGNIAFAPDVDLAVGAFTYAIATGDLNGDGKPDLVSTSVYDQTVSVFINTSTPGNISFAARIDLPTGGSGQDVAVRDMDGDGKPDIVVVNNSSNVVSVYRNTGSGGAVSFAAKKDFGTGFSPSGLAIGDLDGDGKPDLAVVNNLSNTVSLFKNSSVPGTISFAARQDLATTTGTDNPFGIAIADMDGDGLPDMVITNDNIVTTNTPAYGFAIFHNTSSGGAISFSAPALTNFTAGNYYHASFGDLNGDGKPDLVVTDYFNGDNIVLYRNTSSVGSISISQVIVYSAPSAYAVAIGDLDGDGRPDLGVTNFVSDRVSTFRNKIAEPFLSSFGPLTAAAGATELISGANLTGITSVSFGGVPAASFTIVNDGQMNAVVGTGASGNLKVSGPTGSSSLPGFVFAGPPVINAYSPVTAGSRTSVTITGANFTGATGVSFGGVAAGSFQVVAPDTIVAAVGAGASGNVSVTTPYGTATSPGFSYVPLPLIDAFSPVTAATGDTVTITGVNFTGSVAVSFGGVAAAYFTVLNPTTIKAVVGAGAAGAVSVTNANGTGSLAGFTYNFPPTITSVNPPGGVSNALITVVGTHFDNILGLSVGGVDYNFAYTRISSDSIQFNVLPAGASGDIVLSTTGGTAVYHGFLYYRLPQFYTITPDIAGQGMPVTITGTGFGGVFAVTLGGTPVASFTVNSTTNITAIVGPGASGAVGITNPAGTAIANPAFIYTDAPLISSYAPATGPIGTIVTITGGNFSSDDIVYFGAEKASPISATSQTLTVAVPAGATYGPVSVTSPASFQSGYSGIPFTVTFPVDTTAFNAGSFAGHMDFATGVKPTDITVGDVDGDGKPDVAVANFTSGSVSIYLNTSTATQISFAPRKDISIGGIGARNISLSDIDGDGKLDVVVGMGNDDGCSGCAGTGIVILRNRSSAGSVIFDPPLAFSSPFQPMDFMAVGDLNEDGKPDIVGIDKATCISCGGPNGNDEGVSIFAYKNTSVNGTISFLPLTIDASAIYPSIPPANTCTGIAIRDLNGDGKPEIILAQNPYQYTLILKNFSQNNNLFFESLVIDNGVYRTFSTANPAAADFDMDGNPDIVISGMVHRNSGNYNFSSQAIPIFGGSTVVADLNGDGKSDFVWTGFPGDSTLAVTKNISDPGSIAFASQVNYPTLISFKRIVAGDLDGDGKPEIIVANKDNNSFSILRNRVGEPDLATPTVTSFTPTSGGFGTVVTITGTHFSQATSVGFGGLAAGSFTVLSSTSIQAVVDTGSSGSVSVTTPGGTASMATFTFVPSAGPVISSINPKLAVSGTLVTLTGIHFSGATAVNFGTRAAAGFAVVSSTCITAVVDSATSDTVYIVTPDGTAMIVGLDFIPTPFIVAGGPTTFCYTGSVVLRSSETGQAQWYVDAVAIPGASSDTLSVNSAGTYTVTHTVQNLVTPPSLGLTVVMNIAPEKPVITLDAQAGLVSSDSVGNQWYKDTTTLIAGATGQNYRPAFSGSYTVRVTANGCTSPFSDPLAYVSTAVSTVPGSGPYLSITPNPATDHIAIHFNLPGMGVVTIGISDMNGRQMLVRPGVSDGDQIDLSGLAGGVYVMKAFTRKGEVINLVKVIKL